MYLIITDHSTVRVERIVQAFLNIRHNFKFRLSGIQLTRNEAEAIAKQVAIKENKVFTPNTEI